MFPVLIIQIALILIIARSLYVMVLEIKNKRKNWLDILYHASVAIVAIDFLW